jgi:hypothetical protein
MEVSMPTLIEIETALDNGKLFARISNGKYWECRRNGRTQRWKTRPEHFRIPIKFGFRGTGAVEHGSHVMLGKDNIADFQIRERES